MIGKVLVGRQVGRGDSPAIYFLVKEERDEKNDTDR